MSIATKREPEEQTVWSDERLIYSIPVKYELSREDANDIFQSVCLDLYSELPKLREPRALAKWLIQTTLHKCIRLKQQLGRYSDEEVTEEIAPTSPAADLIVAEVEREQVLRESNASLAPRCARMIRMLFFESPARPYEEIARELGLATGSIGFIRGRCLDRLRKQLETRGWK